MINDINPEDLNFKALVKEFKTLQKVYDELTAKCRDSKDRELRVFAKQKQTMADQPLVIAVGVPQSEMPQPKPKTTGKDNHPPPPIPPKKPK
jgi:hypothetical protein